MEETKNEESDINKQLQDMQTTLMSSLNPMLTQIQQNQTKLQEVVNEINKKLDTITGGVTKTVTQNQNITENITKNTEKLNNSFTKGFKGVGNIFTKSFSGLSKLFGMFIPEVKFIGKLFQGLFKPFKGIFNFIGKIFKYLQLPFKKFFNSRLMKLVFLKGHLFLLNMVNWFKRNKKIGDEKSGVGFLGSFFGGKQLGGLQQGIGGIGKQIGGVIKSGFNLFITGISRLQAVLPTLTPSIPIILTLSQQQMMLGKQLQWQSPFLNQFVVTIGDIVMNVIETQGKVIISFFQTTRDVIRDLIDLQKQGGTSIQGFVQISTGLLQLGTGLVSLNVGLQMLIPTLLQFKGLQKLGILPKNQTLGGVISAPILSIVEQFNVPYKKKDYDNIVKTTQLMSMVMKSTSKMMVVMQGLQLFNILDSVLSLFGIGVDKSLEKFKGYMVGIMNVQLQINTEFNLSENEIEDLNNKFNKFTNLMMMITDSYNQIKKQFTVDLLTQIGDWVKGLLGQSPEQKIQNMFTTIRNTIVQIQDNVSLLGQQGIENINIDEQSKKLDSQLQYITILKTFHDTIKEMFTVSLFEGIQNWVKSLIKQSPSQQVQDMFNTVNSTVQQTKSSVETISQLNIKPSDVGSNKIILENSLDYIRMADGFYQEIQNINGISGWGEVINWFKDILGGSPEKKISNMFKNIIEILSSTKDNIVKIGNINLAEMDLQTQKRILDESLEYIEMTDSFYNKLQNIKGVSTWEKIFGDLGKIFNLGTVGNIKSLFKNVIEVLKVVKENVSKIRGDVLKGVDIKLQEKSLNDIVSYLGIISSFNSQLKLVTKDKGFGSIIKEGISKMLNTDAVSQIEDMFEKVVEVQRIINKNVTGELKKLMSDSDMWLFVQIKEMFKSLSDLSKSLEFEFDGKKIEKGQKSLLKVFKSGTLKELVQFTKEFSDLGNLEMIQDVQKQIQTVQTEKIVMNQLQSQQIGQTQKGKKGGWQTGGYTGDGGVFEPQGIVHKGEYVIPQWIVKQFPDLVQSIEQIRVGQVKGYQSGGYVNITGNEVKLQLPEGQLQMNQGVSVQQVTLNNKYEIKLVEKQIPKIFEQLFTLKVLDKKLFKVKSKEVLDLLFKQTLQVFTIQVKKGTGQLTGQFTSMIEKYTQGQLEDKDVIQSIQQFSIQIKELLKSIGLGMSDVIKKNIPNVIKGLQNVKLDILNPKKIQKMFNDISMYVLGESFKLLGEMVLDQVNLMVNRVKDKVFNQILGDSKISKQIQFGFTLIQGMIIVKTMGQMVKVTNQSLSEKKIIKMQSSDNRQLNILFNSTIGMLQLVVSIVNDLFTNFVNGNQKKTGIKVQDKQIGILQKGFQVMMGVLVPVIQIRTLSQVNTVSSILFSKNTISKTQTDFQQKDTTQLRTIFNTLMGMLGVITSVVKEMFDDFVNGDQISIGNDIQNTQIGILQKGFQVMMQILVPLMQTRILFQTNTMVSILFSKDSITNQQNQMQQDGKMQTELLTPILTQMVNVIMGVVKEIQQGTKEFNIGQLGDVVDKQLNILMIGLQVSVVIMVFPLIPKMIQQTKTVIETVLGKEGIESQLQTMKKDTKQYNQFMSGILGSIIMGMMDVIFGVLKGISSNMPDTTSLQVFSPWVQQGVTLLMVGIQLQVIQVVFPLIPRMVKQTTRVIETVLGQKNINNQLEQMKKDEKGYTKFMTDIFSKILNGMLDVIFSVLKGISSMKIDTGSIKNPFLKGQMSLILIGIQLIVIKTVLPQLKTMVGQVQRVINLVLGEDNLNMYFQTLLYDRKKYDKFMGDLINKILYGMLDIVFGTLKNVSQGVPDLSKIKGGFTKVQMTLVFLKMQMIMFKTILPQLKTTVDQIGNVMNTILDQNVIKSWLMNLQSDKDKFNSFMGSIITKIIGSLLKTVFNIMEQMSNVFEQSNNNMGGILGIVNGLQNVTMKLILFKKMLPQITQTLTGISNVMSTLLSKKNIDNQLKIMTTKPEEIIKLYSMIFNETIKGLMGIIISFMTKTVLGEQPKSRKGGIFSTFVRTISGISSQELKIEKLMNNLKITVLQQLPKLINQIIDTSVKLLKFLSSDSTLKIFQKYLQENPQELQKILSNLFLTNMRFINQMLFTKIVPSLINKQLFGGDKPKSNGGFFGKIFGFFKKRKQESSKDTSSQMDNLKKTLIDGSSKLVSGIFTQSTKILEFLTSPSTLKIYLDYMTKNPSELVKLLNDLFINVISSITKEIFGPIFKKLLEPKEVMKPVTSTFKIGFFKIKKTKMVKTMEQSQLMSKIEDLFPTFMEQIFNSLTKILNFVTDPKTLQQFLDTLQSDPKEMIKFMSGLFSSVIGSITGQIFNTMIPKMLEPQETTEMVKSTTKVLWFSKTKVTPVKVMKKSPLMSKLENMLPSFLTKIFSFIDKFLNVIISDDSINNLMKQMRTNPKVYLEQMMGIFSSVIGSVIGQIFNTIIPQMLKPQETTEMVTSTTKVLWFSKTKTTPVKVMKKSPMMQTLEQMLPRFLSSIFNSISKLLDTITKPGQINQLISQMKQNPRLYLRLMFRLIDTVISTVIKSIFTTIIPIMLQPQKITRTVNKTVKQRKKGFLGLFGQTETKVIPEVQTTIQKSPFMRTMESMIPRFLNSIFNQISKMLNMITSPGQLNQLVSQMKQNPRMFLRFMLNIVRDIIKVTLEMVFKTMLPIMLQPQKVQKMTFRTVKTKKKGFWGLLGKTETKVIPEVKTVMEKSPLMKTMETMIPRLLNSIFGFVQKVLDIMTSERQVNQQMSYLEQNPKEMVRFYFNIVDTFIKVVINDVIRPFVRNQLNPKPTKQTVFSRGRDEYQSFRQKIGNSIQQLTSTLLSSVGKVIKKIFSPQNIDQQLKSLKQEQINKIIIDIFSKLIKGIMDEIIGQVLQIIPQMLNEKSVTYRRVIRRYSYYTGFWFWRRRHTRTIVTYQKQYGPSMMDKIKQQLKPQLEHMTDVVISMLRLIQQYNPNIDGKIIDKMMRPQLLSVIEGITDNTIGVINKIVRDYRKIIEKWTRGWVFSQMYYSSVTMVSMQYRVIKKSLTILDKDPSFNKYVSRTLERSMVRLIRSLSSGVKVGGGVYNQSWLRYYFLRSVTFSLYKFMNRNPYFFDKLQTEFFIGTEKVQVRMGKQTSPIEKEKLNSMKNIEEYTSKIVDELREIKNEIKELKEINNQIQGNTGRKNEKNERDLEFNEYIYGIKPSI